MAQLSNAQLITLRNAINANPTWSAFPVDGDGPFNLAIEINKIATPDFFVRKSLLTRHDILTETSLAGTVFTWTGGAYITRSQGERDAFRELFNSTGTVDPRRPNVIAAINDIFSGAGGLVNRTHFTEMSKRKATFGEKIFATGTGTLVSPAELVIEGEITATNIIDARNQT